MSSARLPAWSGSHRAACLRPVGRRRERRPAGVNPGRAFARACCGQPRPHRAGSGIRGPIG